MPSSSAALFCPWRLRVGSGAEEGKGPSPCKNGETEIGRGLAGAKWGTGSGSFLIACRVLAPSNPLPDL